MAPIANELAGENHSSPEVPSPLGEAAALVARLLSESDQPADVDAQSSVSSPSSEHAPVIAELFATRIPSVNPPGDRNKRTVLSLESTRAIVPYSKTGIAFVIVVLAVLIFGAGLAVGYGILARHSAQIGKSYAQAGTPSAVQYDATSEAIHNGASLPSAASVSVPSPAVPLPQANSPAVVSAHNAISSDSDTGHNPPALAAKPQSEQAAPTHATSTLPPVVNDSSAPARTMASIPSNSPSPDSGSSASRSENAPDITSALGSAATLMPSGTGTDAQGTQIHSESSSNATGDALGDSTSHIDPSELVHSVQPLYPLRAKELHVEGDVELRVVVGVDGTVQSVGLVSGPPSLVMAAIDAARQFRYKPALLNGKPIETVQTIQMSFKLKD